MEEKKGLYVHPKRIFKKPEELLKAFEEYKNHLEIESKKWEKVQYVGKDGKRVTDNPKLPYTMEGFKRYCRNHYGEVEQYIINQNGYYNKFVGICNRIKEEIRENQITGGLLGYYNSSITQRLNNLVEKQDLTTNGNEIKTNPAQTIINVVVTPPTNEDEDEDE